MRQLKLKTFFLLLYTFITLLVVSFLYVASIQYKNQYANLISNRIVAILYGLSITLIPIVNADQLNLIEPIIVSVPQHRPFIQYAALSLNGTTVSFSSDKNAIGKPFEKSTLIEHDTIVAEILAGKTSFRLPVTFTSDGQVQHAMLFLKIDKNALSSDRFLSTLYTDFTLSGIIFVLIIGVVFLILRWYLILPMKAFRRLIERKSGEKVFFKISDLTDLYDRLSNSYRELDTKEKSLATAIEVKNYLYTILHTMDLINRLLISDKSIPEIMTESCELLGQHGEYHLAWIGNIVDNRIVIVAHSEDSTGYISHLNLSLDPDDPTSKGPSAQSILTNQTIITQSVNLDYYSQWRNEAVKAGHGSSISLPLRGSANEKPFATMAIYSVKPFGFLDEEITMFEDLAGDIGYAISSRIKQEKLQQALSTDHLTGLPNRAMLLERLSQRDNPRLVLININRFSDINTVYGFDAGDFILRSCAQCLLQFLSKDDGELFKLHSDTFAVLHSNTFGSSSAQLLIDKLTTYLVEHPFTYNGVDIWLTIAAGYSDSTVQIVENAEIALKKAKEDKISFQTFFTSMRINKVHENNIAWYKIIKDAIKEDRVIPYFQPIIHNKTRKIEKYEALIRIIMSDGTVISPFKFLDIAKKTGLYPQLTKIMVQKTIEKFQHHPYRVSLNISTEDIISADIVAFLRNVIAHDSIGQKIVFEILESEGISNYDQVSEFINEFKHLGCQFALDDFGTGYSNFEHLIKLQVDFLKIDGSLVKNLVHDKNAQVIVKNIQNFAAEMGIATIAEFVSSKEIYEIVNSMGITYSQGYYFSEPSRDI